MRRTAGCHARRELERKGREQAGRRAGARAYRLADDARASAARIARRDGGEQGGAAVIAARALPSCASQPVASSRPLPSRVVQRERARAHGSRQVQGGHDTRHHRHQRHPVEVRRPRHKDTTLARTLLWRRGQAARLTRRTRPRDSTRKRRVKLALAVSPIMGDDPDIIWPADEHLVVRVGGAPDGRAELSAPMPSAAHVAAFTAAAAVRLAFLLSDARTPPQLRASAANALVKQSREASCRHLFAPPVVDALCAVAMDCNFAAPPKRAPKSVTRADAVRVPLRSRLLSRSRLRSARRRRAAACRARWRCRRRSTPRCCTSTCRRR